MKWWVTLGLLGLCGTLVFVLARSFGKDPHEVPFKLEGKNAPPFSLQRLDGKGPVSLAELKGQPIVLNFWATWCGPCAAEQPVLDWGARSFAGKVQFLGVLFEDTETNSKDWFDKPSAYPQLMDPQSQIAVDYGVAGVPETYFIDAAGVIRNKFAGAIDAASLRASVEQLLGPPRGGT